MTDVRPLRREDEAAWRRLWTAYLAFYGAALPEAVYAASFARLVDPAGADYRGLLAWRDGAPVGLAHVVFHRHGWQVEDVCYLQDLYVDADVRGSGAGRALIEAVYALADANGTPSVYWLTQESNAEARALYDRIGRVTPFIKYVR
jgi:GNAT superfamily N-acetyltransferase